jgi:hypothetical protein
MQIIFYTLLALPLVLQTGLRSSDAVDLFGLLTAYKLVLFVSDKAQHAVPRSTSVLVVSEQGGKHAVILRGIPVMSRKQLIARNTFPIAYYLFVNTRIV